MPESDCMSYAGLGRRLAAILLDMVIVFSVTLLVAITMRLLIVTGAWVPASGQAKVDLYETWIAFGWLSKLSISFGFVLSAGLLYYPFFHASPWQATIGKRLLNIYVTGDDGKRISIGCAFRRMVARIFLNSTWLSLISIFTIIGTEKRKSLHDYFARTLVLKGRPVPGGSLEPWRIAVIFGIPAVWMLVTFLVTM